MTLTKYRPPLRVASFDHAIARLGSITTLAVEDVAAIRALKAWRSDPPGTELVRGGAGTVRLIIDGWAARVRWLDGDRRQIFNFLLAGDLIGVPPLQSVTTVALTAIQTVDATPLFDAGPQSLRPATVGLLVERVRMTETDLLLDQVVRLGRYPAYERLAHLLQELHDRAVMAGLVTDRRMAFPLTQEMLADATGLSIVHVNRVLQRLRNEHLVDVRHGQLTLTDPDRLSLLCQPTSSDPGA